MSNCHLCIHGHFYQPSRVNPFTGEIQEKAAKPASVKVKLTALKALKDMVAK